MLNPVRAFSGDRINDPFRMRAECIPHGYGSGKNGDYLFLPDPIIVEEKVEVAEGYLVFIPLICSSLYFGLFCTTLIFSSRQG